MKNRTLGQGLEVSAIGLGCMGMSHAYGKPADRREMRELIAAAVDAGCTLFDTAECYGTPDNAHDNEELVGEGKVLCWGLSEVDEGVIRRAHAVTPLAAIENRYSMMARWHEGLFGVCGELGIGYVAFSPLANGLLSGKYADKDAFEDNGEDYRMMMPQFDAALSAMDMSEVYGGTTVKK